MVENFDIQLKNLRTSFDAGKSLNINQRKSLLQKLLNEIQINTELICEAVYEDFHKPKGEMLITEIYPVLGEIKNTISNLKSWSDPKRVWSNVLIQPSVSKIHKSPKGVVMIFAPWNYSFYLSMMPFVSAIAAGNAVVLKPAHETPKLSLMIKNIIMKVFDEDNVLVVLGDGKTIAENLLSNHRFDHIFFTGSTKVGSWIAQKASEKLTPYTLELGGKSPAIVDQYTNLKRAAKRIVWGKFLNAGQTCVCPDYVLIHKSVEEDFLTHCKHSIDEMFGSDAINSSTYTHMINKERFDKVIQYLSDGEIVYGGKSDFVSLCIEPTLMKVKNLELPIMKEEIFGPVLPVIAYENKDEIIHIIRKNRNPLALYTFTENALKNRIMQEIEFGGGCSNHVIVHLGNPNLPFGGIQQSGSGNYHGQWGFDTFSNLKAVVHYAKWFDLSLFYHPYTSGKLNWIKRFFGI